MKRKSFKSVKSVKVAGKRGPGRPRKVQVAPIVKVDKFADEDTALNAGDAIVSRPSDYDIRDEICGLESYRTYQRYEAGDNFNQGW